VCHCQLVIQVENVDGESHAQSVDPVAWFYEEPFPLLEGRTPHEALGSLPEILGLPDPVGEGATSGEID